MTDTPCPTEASRERALTIYYDGACPLCRAEIAHYAGQRGADRLCFVDIAAASQDPGPDLTRADALRRFHVRRADGTLVSGAAAFATLWQSLPAWRRVGRLASHPAILRLLELGYRAILPLRPRLARLLVRSSSRAGRTP